jgi:hypothetical protein
LTGLSVRSRMRERCNRGTIKPEIPAIAE